MLLLKQQKQGFAGMTAKVATAGMAAIAIVAMMIHPAFAQVSFDAATGTGFVGKGDVQGSFTWNNFDVQAEAENLVFSYKDQASYTITCEWEVYPGRSEVPLHFEVTVSREQNIDNSVLYDTRVQQQVSGFYLVGYDTQAGTSAAIPQVGSVCPVEPRGTVTVVKLISSTPGGLYVSDPALSLGPVRIWAPTI